MRTLKLVLLLALAPQWGCVSTSSSQDGSPGPDRYRITQEELQALPSGTAFEAVERFHPNWLRGRAGTVRTDTGLSYPHVFVDGRPFGTAESLHQFGTESIEEIRFINPADATTRYGTGYTGGIIEVILKRSLAG